MEYYSAARKVKFTRKMDGTEKNQNEVMQIQKDKCHTFSLMRVLDSVVLFCMFNMEYIYKQRD